MTTRHGKPKAHPSRWGAQKTQQIKMPRLAVRVRMRITRAIVGIAAVTRSRTNAVAAAVGDVVAAGGAVIATARVITVRPMLRTDRKSTRLNSSHVSISYAVFCLKKK